MPHDFGCEYCRADENRWFGHLDQVAANRAGMILLRCPRCDARYEASAGRGDGVHRLTPEEATTRFPDGAGPFRCPCCGYRTLPEIAAYDICPVCFWEDDGQDDSDADDTYGGPNATSLTQARANVRAFGACEQRFATHVRGPRPEEM